VFISGGIFFLVLHYLSELSLSSINSFLPERPFLSLSSEKYYFDAAIRRLLSTHSMIYDNAKACKPSGELNAKDQQILNNVTRLLPQLRRELIPYPDEYFKGRGIVLTVGPDQLLHTKFNLRIIQWLKTNLSVEVWYSSEQINNNQVNELLNYVPQLDLKMCCFETAQCRSINGKEISVRASSVHAPQTKNVDGKKYAFKLGAIVSSTFAEIIFIDSDCYIVRDPTYLFKNDPMYIKFGSLFYPDIYMSHQHPQIWSALNTTCLNEFELDSGVLVLNKRRVWNGLYMAKLMGDHPEYFYEMFISHGDKDTFRLAFRYMKIPYYIVGIPCSTGFLRGRSFCGVTLCKTDSLGLNVYFDHVHHPKHQRETFLKENFTHTMVALADPNNQTFQFGYCWTYTLPCFQVGFRDTNTDVSLNEYCKTSALKATQRSLIKLPSGESVLWNPNVETTLLLMKKSEETMPGFIDFYFETQKEPIYKNHKL
jgi:hypothetical protein